MTACDDIFLGKSYVFPTVIYPSYSDFVVEPATPTSCAFPRLTDRSELGR